VFYKVLGDPAVECDMQHYSGELSFEDFPDFESAHEDSQDDQVILLLNLDDPQEAVSGDGVPDAYEDVETWC